MTDSTSSTVSETIRSNIETIRNLPMTDTIGQKCSLDIDSDGTLTLSTQHPDINGISMAIYNRVTLSYGLPVGVQPGAVADWLEERLADLQTLVDGLDSEWDGSNMRGTLTDEAQEIHDSWRGAEYGESSLDFLASVSEWEASEWLYPVKADIQGQPTREAALAFAVDSLPEDGLWTDDGQTSYIDREQCEAVAGQWWDEAQPDEDE